MMNNLLYKVLCLCFFILTVTACTSGGERDGKPISKYDLSTLTQVEAAQYFQPGLSAQFIQAKLGPPQGISQVNELQYWNYTRVYDQSDKRVLVILSLTFNEAGLLIDHELQRNTYP